MRSRSKAAVAKIPLIPKMVLAIFSGAVVAAATAQALAMLHH